MEKTIYDLRLHEYMRIKEDEWIMRVPGGWIYNFYSDDGSRSIFVPFSNEFNDDEYPDLPDKDD